MWASSFLLMVTVIFVYVYIISYIIPLVKDIDDCGAYCGCCARETPCCNGACACTCWCTSITIVTGMVVAFILLLYLFVFGIGVASGETLRIFFQFLPSAFLAFVGWLTRTMSIRISGETTSDQQSEEYEVLEMGDTQDSENEQPNDDHENPPSSPNLNHQERCRTHSSADQEEPTCNETTPLLENSSINS